MQIVDRETVTVKFTTEWSPDEAAKQQRRAFFDQMVAAMRFVSVGHITFEGPPHKRWWVRGPVAAGYEIVSNFSQLGFCFSSDDLQRFFYGPNAAANSQHCSNAVASSTTSPPASPCSSARESITAVARPLVASQVLIHSVTSHPQLNGRTAVVKHADSTDDERWVVEVDGEKYSLPASKLRRVSGAPIDVLDSQPSPAGHAREAPMRQEAGMSAEPADPAQQRAPAGKPVFSEAAASAENAERLTKPEPVGSQVSRSNSADSTSGGSPVLTEAATSAEVGEGPTRPEPAAQAASGGAPASAAEGPTRPEPAEGATRPEPAAQSASGGAPASAAEGPTRLQPAEEAPRSEPAAQSASGVGSQSSEAAQSTSRAAPALEEAAVWMEIMERFIRPEPAAPRAGSQDSANSTNGGAPECTICMDAPVDTVFVPCGHMAACGPCAKRLGKRPPCPVCRKKIKLVQHVFRA